jgi:hypothetical protein
MFPHPHFVLLKFSRRQDQKNFSRHLEKSTVHPNHTQEHEINMHLQRINNGNIPKLFSEYNPKRSRDSSVGIATGYGLDDQEGREFESR